MPKLSEAVKRGKEFEGKLVPKLREQSLKLKIKFIRLYDSYSGYTNGMRIPVSIPGQYSDFIFVFKNSLCCLTEFKYTESPDFTLDCLSKTQRIGFDCSLDFDFLYFILVYSSLSEKYYLIPSKKILEINPKKIGSRTFNLEENFSDFSFNKLKDLFEQFKKYGLNGNNI